VGGIKARLAPFKFIKILTARNFGMEAPAMLQYSDIYARGEETRGTEQHSNRQPLASGSHLEEIEVPLRCALKEYPTILVTNIEKLPSRDCIPLRTKIIELEADGASFESFVKIRSEEDLLWHLVEVATDEQRTQYVDDLISSIEVGISENLLEPIFPPDKVVGMNYASRYWEQTKIQLPGYERHRKAKSDGKSVSPIQRGQIGNKPLGTSRQKPSFWDLLFVLLQPPLDLTIPESLALPHDLYPYQIRGVEFLLANTSALLADDMGTGKTVMTLVALKILMQQGKVKRSLIVCPPSVLHEWKRHLEEWAPELVMTFVRGAKQIRHAIWQSPSHVYVTAYSMLRNDIRSGRLPENYHSWFDIVILDEAHHIKNLKSAQTRAVLTLAPQYRWALTGTPIQNRLEDIQSLFSFVNPDLLTPFDSEERVKQKIGPYFLRRRKQEVMPDLPPKVRQELELELDRDQRKAYEQVERESRLEIEALGYKVTKRHIFAKINLLKKICNFAPGKNYSPKLEDLKERLEEIIQSGHKVIIFSQYIGEGINKIEKGLRSYKYAKIVGGQSDAVRSQEIEKFKHSENTAILLASVRSGGEGLNLAEASYVIHFDHWWNPAVMWQAEDRAHRRGQKKSVHIYSYWMAGTIDERIRHILRAKGLLFDNVIDGLAEKEIEELFSMDDLLEILGVQQTAPQKPSFDTSKWRSLSLDEIRQEFFKLKPSEFEDLIQQLMHYLGFPNLKVTKRSGDGGVDVISTRNTGQGVERIAVQCKRYKSNVGVKLAREFLGAIQDDPSIIKGYLITSGGFTQACTAFCQRNEIEMISGLQLAEYVRKFSLGS